MTPTETAGAPDRPTAEFGAGSAQRPYEPPTAVQPPSLAPAPAPAPVPAPNTGPALAMPAADQCVVCGARLAGDQRYCTECGERRGKARFTLAPPPPEQIVSTRRVRTRPRISPSTTLVAGVATLLLAMGDGVLIGTLANHNTPVRAASGPVQVVTVGGGGGANTGANAATTASTANAGSSANGGKKSKSSSSHHKAAGAITTTVKNIAPPTVTMGQSGTGAGYQNGHFTGNFFGP